MSGIRIGEVIHVYDKISVAVIALTETIRLGDTVHVLGHSTDFQQKAASLQIEHQPGNEAGRGQEGGRKKRVKGKMWVDVEKKGQPSKWVTLRALRVLKAAGRE